jgi:hypothetical protein
MRTVSLIVKRSLVGLFGMLVFATLCVASTMPSFRLRITEEQEDGLPAQASAKPVSRNSVVAAHGPQHRAAGGLKPTSSDPKTTKSVDRKAAQTTSALTGCKDFTPANGAPVVLGKKNSAGKTYNSQEKNLCNPGSPRSR